MGYYNLPPTTYAAELNDLEKLLRNLPLEGAIKALDLLEKITRNLIQNPGEEKYRRVRITNEKLAPLFGLSGSIEVMYEMGWQQDGEFIILPAGTILDFPTHIVKILEAKSHYGKQAEIAKKSAKLQSDPNKAVLLKQLEIDRRERAAGDANLPIAVARPTPVLEKVTPMSTPTLAPNVSTATTVTPAVVPTPAAAPAATKSQATAQAGGATKPKSAFDFENRAKVEARKEEGEMSLQELRQLQKDKFKEFQADPNAHQSDAYHRPPSGGAQEEPGWFDWLWGSSSSSTGGGGGGGGGGGHRRDPPPGPRMKTINDLPKSAPRGGG